MKMQVLHNQSILDFAIQHTGDVQNAFQIAKENSLAVTSLLVPGYELIIPEGVAFNREILDYYKAKEIKPATDYEIEEGGEAEFDGIGYWIINKTFIVQ